MSIEQKRGGTELPQQTYPEANQLGQDYYVENSPGRNDPFPLFDYLQLLWFRRKLIIAVSVLVAIIGFIHVNQLIPVYTASSTLLVGIKEAQVVDINPVLSRDDYSDDIQVEVEVLRSRSLAAKVIDKLNLLSYAEFNPSLRAPRKSFFDFLKYLDPRTWIPGSWKKAVVESISSEVRVIPPSEDEIARRKMAQATDIFLSNLSVAPVKFSSVLKISFNSTSPVLAARIANEIPEAYMLDQLQAEFEATEQATSWLTEKLSGMETEVVEAERAVEIYRQTHNLAKSTGTNIQEKELSELNSQLIIARAERAQAEARLEQLTRLEDTDGLAMQMAGDVLSSPLVQQLRSQQAEAISRKSELSVEYGPKHPRILQVNAELEDIKQRLEFEIGKITLALENELELARTREMSLQQSLRQSELRSDEQSRESVQLRALERKATASRILYETFLNRYKETSSTKGIESSGARVISVAEVPQFPSYPDKRKTFIVIVMFGFGSACALVFALYFLNPGLHSPEQVEKELGIHCIGMVPKLPPRKIPFQYVIDKPQSSYMEAINSLKISLQLSDPDATIKAIEITSSVPAEGKSSLTLSLAVLMVREGKKVLVIDGDLRRGKLDQVLGLTEVGPGLTDFVLATTDSPDEFIVKHEPTGMDFMSMGDAKYVNATDIFTSQRMRKIVNNLKEKYDYILFDTPPVMTVADARVVGQLVDKTIFVVRWDKTPRKVVRASIDLLSSGGTRIAGIVLQQVDLKRYGKLGYGDSGYYYHYGTSGAYYKS